MDAAWNHTLASALVLGAEIDEHGAVRHRFPRLLWVDAGCYAALRFGEQVRSRAAP
jgi:hypothetical protein